ncbi:MAG: fatty acid desaturase family protein [Pseudomonadota bacterium]
MSAASRVDAAHVDVRTYLAEPQVRAALQALRQPSTARFLIAALGDYALIIAVAALHAQLTGWVWWLLLVPALIVIGARQHGLLVLMHDATHFCVARSRRVNDWLGELLTAAPLFANLRGYRRTHLAHHRHLNTPQDPDWVRKTSQPKQRRHWEFPNGRSTPGLLLSLYWQSVLYLFGTFVSMSSPTSTDADGVAEPRDGLATARILCMLAIVAAVVLSGLWPQWLLYWVLPIFSVVPMLNRIRSIAEHFALDHVGTLRHTRSVDAGPIERALLAPHFIGLHAEHHLVASIPGHRLPALRALLQRCPAYARETPRCDSYLGGGHSLLRDMRGGYPSRLLTAGGL